MGAAVGLSLIGAACAGNGSADTDGPDTSTSQAASITTTAVPTTRSPTSTKAPPVDDVPSSTKSSDGVPSSLILPGATPLGEIEGTIFGFRSEDSFEKALAFYVEAVGREPVNVSGSPGERVASFIKKTLGEKSTLIEVKEADGTLLISIALPNG